MGVAPGSGSSQGIPMIKSIQSALHNERLHFDQIAALLDLDENSPLVETLMAAAHAKTRKIAQNQGQIWFAIGLDSAPCPLNCSFCSFGEKWRANSLRWKLEPEQVMELIRENDQPGIANIVLRTTALFPLADLLEIGKRVMPLTHAKLTANRGDFDEDEAARLARAGFQTVYHTWRLGEGIDTQINPAARLATINTVKHSTLELAALVEPVGAEHTVTELAERIVVYRDAEVALSGAMSRVNVPGTPKENCPSITTRRLAQITAVIRLALDANTHSICSHPPGLEVVMAGANTVVVDSGAIPRDVDIAHQPWRAFTVNDARRLLRQAGYEI